MRIEGPTPHPWTVYHAEWCCVLHHVLWVDDESNQWCEAIQPVHLDKAGEIAKRIHQAKRIEIHRARALVVINPIADEPGAGEQQPAEVAAPCAA